VTLSTNNSQAFWQTEFISSSGLDESRFAGVEYQWWFNPTNPNSLRLTRTGSAWIKKYTKLRFYNIDLAQKIFPKQLLQLERLVKSPYYIQNLQKLEVIDETTVIMLQLHAGNLAQYLDNLEDNQ
jgi:hypothetical protein